MPTDIQSFPRRGQTLSQHSYPSAPWRVFWHSPMITTGVANFIQQCPYPFPGRYFVLGTASGWPTGATPTQASPATYAPLIRVTGVARDVVGAGASFSLRVSLNNNASVITLTSVPMVTSVGGYFTGHLSLDTVTTLRYMGVAMGDTTAFPVTSMTYGGQDLWFSVLQANNADVASVVIEYIDIPL